MTINDPAGRLTSLLFRDDEPVLQGRALLSAARRPGARVPLFGDTDSWDCNGVLRRPANLKANEWQVPFTVELADPFWNLLAREMAMVMANPQHEALQEAGIYLGDTPASVRTLRGAVYQLRAVINWAEVAGIPPNPQEWTATDLKRRVKTLDPSLSAASVIGTVSFIRRMVRMSSALSGGWPAEEPWPGKSAKAVAQATRADAVSTKPIPPGIWFALVRAAWAYVHTFAPDVLRAIRRRDELLQVAKRSIIGASYSLDSWLADPANQVPVYYAPGLPEDQPPAVNWPLMTLFLGIDPTLQGAVFGAGQTALSRSRRAAVLEAVEQGRYTHQGLVEDLAQVTRSDGSKSPWHPGIQQGHIEPLRTALRNAAFVLVAALSMMRDSELHEIGRGCIVEHYNTPAVASTLQKGHQDQPRKHWWITEPVVEAIELAETLSLHAERVFAPFKRPKTSEAIDGALMIDSFTRFVNAHAAWAGLEPIPVGRVRPHMFRRTMAMLTDQFAGSEIALGIQLKHIATRALANRSTRGYAAPDEAWAKHLEGAIEAARFRRLRTLYNEHKDGKMIGYGPGADRVKEAFDDITDTVRARGGDARVEEDLLRKARITIRFGALNNCLFDPSNPSGAICLENTVIPEGHTGPLDWRCRPDRCHNSMIGIEHVPIYDAHRRTQVKLLQTPGLPSVRKDLISRELERAEAVLKLTSQEET
ncbi:integrase [Streptomyces chartreusis]|uniref:integrase n=1 Tax=Streptomyces TaxID=1883 RepID=UPI00342942D6